MQKIILFFLFTALTQTSFGQKLGAYLFARIPHSVSCNMKTLETTYLQGVSTGVGFYHGAKFLELGTFLTQEDSYGYYSFFGSTIKSRDDDPLFRLKTNWFGEVTNMPAQAEQSDEVWVFTAGIGFSPSIHLDKLSVGVPFGVGLAYQEGTFSLNSRLILNVSFGLN